MQKLEVFGANKLKGQIKISGSKNASLPILAATLLSSKKVYLKNYELDKIEKETIFNDLIKVMEFLNRYVMDEELDEIYRIDSKYDRAKNLSIIK